MLQRFQGDRAAMLGAVGIFSLSLIGSGYLLGDGLRRAKMADRSVTVRGVSERDVTADLATWTISFSEEGPELGAVNQRVFHRLTVLYGKNAVDLVEMPFEMLPHALIHPGRDHRRHEPVDPDLLAQAWFPDAGRPPASTEA